MRTKPKVFTPRKLLVAVAGVASVNYVLACEKPHTSGNLMAPIERPDAEPPTPPTSGNLAAPPDVVGPAPTATATADAGAPSDAGAVKDAGAAKDAGKPVLHVPVPPRRPPTGGNLMAPPSSNRP